MEKNVMEMHFKNLIRSMDKMDGHISKLFEKQEQMHVCLTENRSMLEAQTKQVDQVSKAIHEHANVIQAISNNNQKLDFSTRNMLSDVHTLKHDVKILNSSKSKLDMIPKGFQIFGTLIGIATSIFGTYFLYMQVFLK